MGGRDPFGRHVDDIAKTKAEKPIESYNEEDTSTLEEIQDEFDGDFDDNFDYELEWSISLFATHLVAKRRKVPLRHSCFYSLIIMYAEHRDATS